MPPLTYAVRDLSVPGPLLIWVVLPSRSKERVVTLSGVSLLEVVRTRLTSGHAVRKKFFLTRKSLEICSTTVLLTIEIFFETEF